MQNEEKNQTLDAFLRRLITAPKVRQADAIQSALALLDGKPADALLYSGAQAARMLSMSKPSLWRAVKNRVITPVMIPGFGRPRYRRADLERLAVGEAGVQ